jgi:integrase
MATIENRSRYVVSVKNREDLYREFPFTNLSEAKLYAKNIQAEQKLKPVLTQKKDAFFVRIRQTGYKTVQKTFATEVEAATAIARIEAERINGIFIDYTKAHKVTFEHLLRRYMAEEGPKKKGWEKSEKYRFNAWLEDLDGGLTKRRDQATTEAAKLGKPAPRLTAREPTAAVQWMRKPFTAIDTMDIESYIAERVQQVAKATVDRELDSLRAVFTVATTIWKYRLTENPMDTVRRPHYFNERERRLKSDEHRRLLDAAFEEDKNRCIELRTEELMAAHREAASSLQTVYAKKNLVKGALKEARAQAEQDFVHVPLYETYINFQIMTAARRSESLRLAWDDVDFEKRSAYLAETKNGNPRSLPLRADLVEMLEALPKNGPNVFPISADNLRKAWARIVERAGIEDLHIHDLRHEGISLVAETSKFSLIDLQKFSGHRDVRMLMRYAHLCTTHMAHKLDEAFGGGKSSTEHRGRKRLKHAAVTRIGQAEAEASASNVFPLFGKDAA